MEAFNLTYYLPGILAAVVALHIAVSAIMTRALVLRLSDLESRVWELEGFIAALDGKPPVRFSGEPITITNFRRKHKADA